MLRQTLTLAVAAVSLAGCVPPEKAAPSPGASTCQAEKYDVLRNQPEAVLAQMSLPKGTRIIRPGQPVTMDFRPDRLNIEIGADKKIARIGCY